jgi:hypothetical protein
VSYFRPWFLWPETKKLVIPFLRIYLIASLLSVHCVSPHRRFHKPRRISTLKTKYHLLCLSPWLQPIVEYGVGEFRKTRHPRNVKFDKVLKTCFSGAGNSRFSEAWNLWSPEFANVWSSGILIRWSDKDTDMRRPGTSSWRWRELRRKDSSGICRGPSSEVMREDMHELMKKRRPVRESVEDPVRRSCAKTFTNRRRSKVKVVVSKSPGLDCELVADL